MEFKILPAKLGGSKILISENDFTCEIITNDKSLQSLSKIIDNFLNKDEIFYAKKVLLNENLEKHLYFHINNGGVTISFDMKENAPIMIIEQSHFGVLKIKNYIKVNNDILKQIRNQCLVNNGEPKIGAISRE